MLRSKIVAIIFEEAWNTVLSALSIEFTLLWQCDYREKAKEFYGSVHHDCLI